MKILSKNQNFISFVFCFILAAALFLFLPGETFAWGGGSEYLYGDDEIDVQEQGMRPATCCLLKHKITMRGGTSGQDYNAGYSVGKPGTTCSNLGSGLSSPYYSTPHWAGLCFLDGVLTFSEWIMWVGIIATVTSVIIAGIIFAVSSGSEEMIKKAKKAIIWGIGGIAVIIGSQIIPGIIRYFIGV